MSGRTPIRNLPVSRVNKENNNTFAHPNIKTSTPLVIKHGVPRTPDTARNPGFHTPLIQPGMMQSRNYTPTGVPAHPFNPMNNTTPLVQPFMPHATARSSSAMPASSSARDTNASNMDAINLQFENMNLKQDKDKWQLACIEMQQEVEILLNDIESVGKALQDSQKKMMHTQQSEADARKQYDEMSQLLDQMSSREEKHLQDIKSAGDEIEAWKQKFQTLHHDAAEKLKSAHQLNEDYKHKAAQFDETKSMLTRKNEDVAAAAQKVEELERRCHQADMATKEARDNQAVALQESERARAEERSLRLEVHKLKNEIMELRGGRVSTASNSATPAEFSAYKEQLRQEVSGKINEYERHISDLENHNQELVKMVEQLMQQVENNDDI